MPTLNNHIQQTSLSNSERDDLLQGIELDKESLEQIGKELEAVVGSIKEFTFNNSELTFNMMCFLDNLRECITDDFDGTACSLLNSAEKEIHHTD